MIDTDISICNISDFLESTETTGVLIGQSDPIQNPNQLHCGIVYKYQNKFNAIHLAWHNVLKNDDDTTKFPNYLYIKSAIPISRQNSIAAMCRLILKRKNEKQIPYGLLYSGGKFTKDGILNLDSKESGLTCATFVLAVYDTCQIKLIDFNNWQPRVSDKEWHNYIIDCLIQTKDIFNISELHIENVTNEIGCARFRPEEVAISSALNDFPADSDRIIEQGEALKNLIIR